MKFKVMLEIWVLPDQLFKAIKIGGQEKKAREKERERENSK
jgi:hypothetical protein